MVTGTAGFLLLTNPGLALKAICLKVLNGTREGTVFIFLPLILGFIGLIYHFRKSRKDVFVVLVLFFLTGPCHYFIY